MSDDNATGQLARREDARLIRGAGRYVGDIDVPDCLEVAFVRSTVAHGRLVSVGTGEAAMVDGVVAVWSAADLGDELPIAPAYGHLPDHSGRTCHALAVDHVRYVGEPVAVVAGLDRYVADDGAYAVRVDIDPLPAVVDPTTAAASSVWLFEGMNNVVDDMEFGEPITDEVWEQAAVVVEGVYRQPRVVPTPMEARAILAIPEADGRLTVWASHQAAHHLRDDLVNQLGLDPGRVRVRVADSGGAFGSKSATYREYLLVVLLALRLGRPVRWLEDRAEALTGSSQARAQNLNVRLAADENGRMLALDLRADAGVGGYPLGAFVAVETGLAAGGVYRTPKVHARIRTVVTNTTPTNSYRGAGRPEQTYAVERTLDLLARRLDIDPAELRRRNYIPPEAFPYRSPTGRIFDGGQYELALGKALELLDYQSWREEQRRRRKSVERPIGIGLCSFVERAGLEAPEGAREWAALDVAADGRVTARVGTQSTGQSHETVFPKLVASTLGVPAGQVSLIEGAAAATPEPLRAEGTYNVPAAFSFGTYAAVVEVDAELGVVHILRMVAVDDCGVAVEAGCIGAPPAIVNAVIDALGPAATGNGAAGRDIGGLQLPLTPEMCWLTAGSRREGIR